MPRSLRRLEPRCAPSASPPARPAAVAPAVIIGRPALPAAFFTAEGPLPLRDVLLDRVFVAAISAPGSVEDLAEALGLVAHSVDVLADVLRRLAELLARLAHGLRNRLHVEIRELDPQERLPARAASQHQATDDTGSGGAHGHRRSAGLVGDALERADDAVRARAGRALPAAAAARRPATPLLRPSRAGPALGSRAVGGGAPRRFALRR